MKQENQATEYKDDTTAKDKPSGQLSQMITAFTEMLKKTASGILNDEKKGVNFLVFIGAAGMLLLALSEWLPGKADAKSAPKAEAVPATTAQYAEALQQNLEEILGRVNGVGRVEVMVTLESAETTVYAYNTQTQADGSGSQTYAEISSQPLCQTTRMPAVQGVAIVCDGGDDARLVYQLTNMAAALTGAGSNRICVAKRTPDNR